MKKTRASWPMIPSTPWAWGGNRQPLMVSTAAGVPSGGIGVPGSWADSAASQLRKLHEFSQTNSWAPSNDGPRAMPARISPTTVGWPTLLATFPNSRATTRMMAMSRSTKPSTCSGVSPGRSMAVSLP